MIAGNALSFGRGLLAERKARKWTQEQLATEMIRAYNIHISLSSIHRWEHGDAMPHPSTLEKLYRLFRKTVETWGLVEEKVLVWNVPFARNLHFTGRELALADIHTCLGKKRPVALCGLGGIGKTQTAVEYAYRYSDNYDTVLWVRADTSDSLIADIGAIVELLDLPEKDERNQARVIRAFKLWLQTHTSWLLIFDNADTIDTISDFLLLRGGGAILLTTRVQRVGRYIKKIEMEKLSCAEGVALLLCRTDQLEEVHSCRKISEHEESSAVKLHELMDGLPLALDQAASYIEETQCSAGEYLALYQAQPARLLKRTDSVNTRDYPYSVATTWTLSFQHIAQTSLAAADLLSLCAFLHPDAIPIEFVTQGSKYLGSSIQQVADNAAELNETVGILINYSLLRRDPETQVLTIHRLVQAVLKQNMSKETYEQWVERAVLAVNVTFPSGDFANWERCEYYLPHVQVCAALIEQHQLVFREAANLLHCTGDYLRRRSRFAEAEKLLRQALAMREQIFGVDHLTTTEAVNALGVTITEMGHFEEAEQLLSRALAMRERQLGEAHLAVAETLYHLAHLYHSLGRYNEAETRYMQSLAMRQQLLGPLHLDVASILNYLGELYSDQNRLDEAEPFIRQALAIREQQLEPIHPDIAECVNNIALIYMKQNKDTEAEQLLLRAVELMKQQLGPYHRYTATGINNLAQVYNKLGRNAEAEQLWLQVMVIREQTLGLDHPDLVNVIYYLTMLYHEQDRLEDARPLLERAMTMRELRVASVSPRVIARLNELAALHQRLVTTGV
jgi:tetratricopeptide (TPR) repeat protein/transcriptional regulator with XRE-family HTH domain